MARNYLALRVTLFDKSQVALNLKVLPIKEPNRVAEKENVSPKKPGRRANAASTSVATPVQVVKAAQQNGADLTFNKWTHIVCNRNRQNLRKALIDCVCVILTGPSILRAGQGAVFPLPVQHLYEKENSSGFRNSPRSDQDGAAAQQPRGVSGHGLCPQFLWRRLCL